MTFERREVHAKSGRRAASALKEILTPVVPISNRRKQTPETNNFRLGVVRDARTMAGGAGYVRSWRLIHQSRAQQVSSINLSAVTQLIC